MNCFKLISKHRDKLMGLAIILVVLFHSGLSRYMPFKGIQLIFSAGYGGVDIFLFLSGFGLFYSMMKSPKLTTFYWNRFIRIMPLFALYTLANYLIEQNYSLIDYIFTLLTIDFWLYGDAIDWYIPTLMMIYLLFPFYFKLYIKSPVIVTIIISLLSIIILYTCITEAIDMKKLVITRIPIFCIGVHAGKLSLSKESTPKKVVNLLYGLSVLGMIVLYHVYYYMPGLHWNGFLWYPFILIIPGLLIFVCKLFEKIDGRYHIESVLSFFGKITLELYLCHMVLVNLRNYMIGPLGLNFIASTLFFIVLSVAISYPLYLGNSKLYNKLKKI